MATVHDSQEIHEKKFYKKLFTCGFQSKGPLSDQLQLLAFMQLMVKGTSFLPAAKRHVHAEL